MWHARGGGARATAGVSFPSGQRVLDADERVLARSIALPVLDFPIREFGRGTEVMLGGTLSHVLTDHLIISGGAGGTYRAAYEWQQGAEDYRPASEAALTLGLDWLSGANDLGQRSRPVRADVTYRRYSADQVGDSTIFKEGGQWELHAATTYTWVAMDQVLELRALLKDASRQVSALVVGPPEVEWQTGDAMLVSWQFGRTWRPGTRAGGSLVFAEYSNSDVAERNGRSFDAGLWLERAITRGTNLRFSVSRLWGQIDDASGGHLNADGMNWSVGMSYAPPGP
jgi:hypothetical protein